MDSTRQFGVSPHAFIVAPTGIDGSLICSVLTERGVSCSEFSGLSGLARRIDAETGVLILAVEALDADEMETLHQRLVEQPAWSDLPIIVLTGENEDALLHPLIEELTTWTGNISFLERPLRVQTLVSAVRVALRGRGRQYEVRKLLQEREEILTSIRDGFIVLDRALQFKYVNERAAELAGRPASEILGRGLLEVFPAASNTDLEVTLREAFQIQQIITKDYYEPFSKKWISIRVYPSLEHITVIAADISKEKQAEEQLRRSEERYRLILENANDHAIFSLDLGGSIRTWNQGACNLFGFAESEIIGQPEELLFPPIRQLHEEIAAERNEALRTHTVRVERRMIRKSGGLFWCSSSIAPLTNTAGKVCGFLRIVRDITEYHNALERVAASEARFRDLSNAMPQIVWTAQSDGTLDYFNERWIEFTGMDKHQGALWSWIDLVHEEDRELCLSRWRASLASGDPFECEARLRRGHSPEHRWHLGRAEPGLRDGALDRWYGTWTNIEEQKKTEALQESARRELEKLNNAKDRFFATLSHELRTPLTPALFIAGSLSESEQLSAEGRADLETLKRNLDLETRLIDDLLDMSRIIHGKLAIPFRAVESSPGPRKLC